MGTNLAITCAEWTYKSSKHSSEIVLNTYEYHLDSAAAKAFQSTHTKDRNSLRHDKSLKQASKHFQWNCLILGHKEMKWLVWRGLNLHSFSLQLFDQTEQQSSYIMLLYLYIDGMWKLIAKVLLGQRCEPLYKMIYDPSTECASTCWPKTLAWTQINLSANSPARESATLLGGKQHGRNIEIGTFVYKLTAAASPLSVLKLASAVSDTQYHSTGVDCSVWPMSVLMTITVLLLHDVVTLCHCLYTRAANDEN